MSRCGRFLLTALAPLLFFQLIQTSTQANDPAPAIDTRLIGLPTLAQAMRFLKNAPDLTPERFQRWSGINPDRGLDRDTWRFADGTILTTYIQSNDGSRRIACWIEKK